MVEGRPASLAVRELQGEEPPPRPALGAGGYTLADLPPPVPAELSASPAASPRPRVPGDMAGGHRLLLENAEGKAACTVPAGDGAGLEIQAGSPGHGAGHPAARATTLWLAHGPCGPGHKSLQSCLTLLPYGLNSPPGSSLRGILLARILEWVAIFFSRESSRPRDRTWVFALTSGVPFLRQDEA